MDGETDKAWEGEGRLGWMVPGLGVVMKLKVRGGVARMIAGDVVVVVLEVESEDDRMANGKKKATTF
ncbi:hypothetical protein ACH5RR_036198 [Cinchona calisaya]|uniref:Uncharacterized protein n=1 Tax=Cinchona calisaya TaxID=153742 RepID=A0ABD2Y2I3_9GENT